MERRRVHHLHGEADVSPEGGWKVNGRARGMPMMEEGDRGSRDTKAKGGNGEEREKEREKTPRAIGTGMALSSLAGPFAAVQFETGHQRCLHTMATPP